MKLLLCSWGPWRNALLEKTFLDLLTKPTNHNTVNILSINTTSDFFKKHLNIAKTWLTKIGFQQTNIQVYNLKSNNIPSFENLDILLMFGGNNYHYLQQIRQKNLVTRIREFIDSDGIYVGSSAGSNIMAPDLDENLSNDVNDISLEDLKGFRYIDFHLLVHWNTTEGEARTSQIQYAWKTGKRVIPLTDQQAILVQNDGFKIISPDVI